MRGLAMQKLGIASVLLSTSVAGCGDGEGTVDVRVYGEPFIEEGIPAAAMNDGWAISFTRFQVLLSDVRVAGAQIEVPGPVDLAQASSGAGHELGSALVAEGPHGDAAFIIDRLEIEGSALRGSEARTFDWMFDDATSYEDCEAVTTVPDAGVATLQIAIHADHLFYDSLVAEEPRRLFQPIADADASGDGEVTREELRTTDIGAYDPGSEGGVENLWDWLMAASRTLGHVDGEGHCHAAPATSD
jgi:hypothetical protein